MLEPAKDESQTRLDIVPEIVNQNERGAKFRLKQELSNTDKHTNTQRRHGKTYDESGLEYHQSKYSAYMTHTGGFKMVTESSSQNREIHDIPTQTNINFQPAEEAFLGVPMKPQTQENPRRSRQRQKKQPSYRHAFVKTTN